jgi:hypothetical protein
MAHEWKRGQQSDAVKKPICDLFRGCSTILRDPVEDALEVGDGLIVEDKLHRRLRTEAFDASACLCKREQLTIRIGDPATHFGNLFVRQLDLVHVSDVVQQRSCSGVLFAFRELLDLTDGLF